MQADLFGKERERGKPDAHVEVVTEHGGILHSCSRPSPYSNSWHHEERSG